MMRAVLLTLLACVACAAASPATEIVSGVALQHGMAGDAPFTNWGLSATLGSDVIVCRRAVDGEPIRYLTYERAGERSAYGVYGLAGPKNGLPVDVPLSGDPIAWPERDAVEALVFLLGTAGVDARAAADLVDQRGAVLFAEGLRVLFVVPDEPPLLLAVELP